MIDSIKELRESFNDLTIEEIASVALTRGDSKLAELANRYYSDDIETEEFIGGVLSMIGASDDANETPALISTGEGPEPSGIRFESQTCGRCGGKGRKQEGGWGANNKGVCFRCNGRCVVDTTNGYRARKAYNKMRDAELGTTWGQLADREVFLWEGEYHEKGNHPSLILLDSTIVYRHNGAVTRTIWRKIAKTYAGATLKFPEQVPAPSLPDGWKEVHHTATGDVVGWLRPGEFRPVEKGMPTA